MLFYPSQLSGFEKKPVNKVIRIAVLDSGYSQGDYPKAKLCKIGHKDFTGTGIQDNLWHGTHITNIIADRIKHSNYCIIIVKWYDPNTPRSRYTEPSNDAFQYVLKLKVDVVNYSAGGSYTSKAEKRAIAKLLARGVKVFVAAGNESRDLNQNCTYFPACYNLNKLVVVGNKTVTGPVEGSSNYGNVVNHWEVGTNVLAYDGTKLRYATGTSQATAVSTGIWVNRRSND